MHWMIGYCLLTVHYIEITVHGIANNYSYNRTPSLSNSAWHCAWLVIDKHACREWSYSTQCMIAHNITIHLCMWITWGCPNDDTPETGYNNYGFTLFVQFQWNGNRLISENSSGNVYHWPAARSRSHALAPIIEARSSIYSWLSFCVCAPSPGTLDSVIQVLYLSGAVTGHSNSGFFLQDASFCQVKR